MIRFMNDAGQSMNALGKEADKREHAARGIAVAAPGMRIRIAIRARGRSRRRKRRDAGRSELTSVGREQAEEVLSRPARRSEEIFGKSSREKFASNIFADLIAGGPDARPGRGDDVGGICTEPGPHRFDRLSGDPQTGPLPSGMHGRGDAKAGIEKEKGQAIGGLDDQKEAGDDCHQSISRRPFRRDFLDDMNDIRMDLVEENRSQTVFSSKSVKPVFGQLAPAESVDEARDPGEPFVGKVEHIG